MEKERLLFKVFNKKGETFDFEVNILGKQNIPNLLGAIIAAKELGMSLKEISEACLKIKQEQGAMILLKGKEDPFVLDASYSSNPDGVIADLDYLRTWQFKKAIVMPCLIELGEASKEIHRKIGKKIGQVCDLAIITTKERFNEIKEEAVKAGINKEKILLIENSEEIMRKIDIFSSPGDVVLLEGRVPKKLVNL